ncbi:hypothetical protein TcWFU_009574 [Taenia crassiceps]|uniref:Uncharacterized protein n=1 Tax=Taenia crassiceps TaxID=6207 RepID=A0ABR4QMZ7_9CEST
MPGKRVGINDVFHTRSGGHLGSSGTYDQKRHSDGIFKIPFSSNLFLRNRDDERKFEIEKTSADRKFLWLPSA